MVMEKSWNMKNWPKDKEFCDQSRNFTNFTPNCTKFILLVTEKKLVSNLGSPQFPTSQNVANAKSGREMIMENQEMVMENSRKTHRKIFCQGCGNPVNLIFCGNHIHTLGTQPN